MEVRFPRRAPSTPVVGLAALLLATTLLAACGGGSGAAGSDDPPRTGVVSSVPAVGHTGAAVYAQSCARCHGALRQGKGDSPALDDVRMATVGDQRLRITIANGKGRMPGFGGLTAAQVDAVVSYLMEA